MAHSKIYFSHPQTGKMREAPVGFSWTVFFFGFFPPLFRGHWVGFFILLLTALVTAGFSNILFMFIYNKMYIKHLIADGYKAKSSSTDLDFVQQRAGLQIPRYA